MTHLYIELNGITEEVSSSVISKLYELASSGTLDGTSNLKGRLHSTAARDIHVAYLNEQFQDLHISVDTLYISFVDPEVERVLINQWGDGSNITAELINSHNNTGSIFKSNTTITSFDELDRFASITTISNQAFEGASNLTSIGLSNIQYIGWNAFKGADITGSISMPNIKVIGSVSESGAGNRGLAFAGNKHITSVSCGSYLTHLFDYSFTNCTSLQTVTGLDNLQTIGPSVFSGCSALTSVTGLSNITSIPAGMFNNCTSLTTVDIDWTKITSINLYAFDNCTSLLIGQLSVPNITFLGQFAFRNTKVLTVTNLGSITTLQPQVFRGCSSLTSVTLPATITEIRNHAFCDCTSLTTINIPSTCTSIYNNAFEACSNLDVTLDLSNVTDVGAQAFKDCTKLKISNLPKASSYPSQLFLAAKGLTNVVIPKEVVTIGSSCFNQCTNIQTVTFELNSQLDYIKDNAFNSCGSLLTLIIPEGCTKIGDGAFASSGITLLDIPSTVTEIGSVAFRNLPLATTIIFRCNVPTFGSTSDIFAYSSYDLQLSTVSIYVPDDLVAAYKAVPCLSNVIDHIYGISQMPN